MLFEKYLRLGLLLASKTPNSTKLLFFLEIWVIFFEVDVMAAGPAFIFQAIPVERQKRTKILWLTCTKPKEQPHDSPKQSLYEVFSAWVGFLFTVDRYALYICLNDYSQASTQGMRYEKEWVLLISDISPSVVIRFFWNYLRFAQHCPSYYHSKL